jgi:hypothetical protein
MSAYLSQYRTWELIYFRALFTYNLSYRTIITDILWHLCYTSGKGKKIYFTISKVTAMYY